MATFAFGGRRRGDSLAAAAVTLAFAAPLVAPVNTGVDLAAVAQDAPTAKAEGAIYSPGEYKDQATVNGTEFVDRSGA